MGAPPDVDRTHAQRTMPLQDIPGPAVTPDEEREAIYRRMILETMLPCPELPAAEREQLRERHRAEQRDAELWGYQQDVDNSGDAAGA